MNSEYDNYIVIILYIKSLFMKVSEWYTAIKDRYAKRSKVVSNKVREKLHGQIYYYS